MKGKTSLTRWVVNHYGGKSAKEAIALAVYGLLQKYNQKELPVKLSGIAEGIGINPQPIYQMQTPFGQIISLQNEFRIALKMKTEKPPSIYWHGYPKLKFAYAHELIHCLFYDLSKKPPERIAPKAKNNEEETLCNYGAGLLILPPHLVREYINGIDNRDIINLAIKLSRKSQTSLHTSFLHLINEQYLDKSVNTLYILSQKSEGYRNRGVMKPRCIISVFYNENGTPNTFLPAYKGLDSIGKSWSLIRFHNKLPNNTVFEEKVRNEIIAYSNCNYLLNGRHYRVRNSSYVWSELSVLDIDKS